MSALERIAFYRGRRDEVPNQELARELAEAKDEEGIAEIAEHLWDRERNVASDCLKVLYEVGYIDPGLVEPYAEDFVKLLGSRNNRMVWGAMIGLWTVADGRPEVIWEDIDKVMDTIRRGTVITQVSGVKALAVVASKDPAYEERIRPFLLSVLRGCEPKLVPTHAEAMLIMVVEGNRDEFLTVLEARKGELRKSQGARLRKVLRALENK